jgi:hypothetical protein
MADRKLLSDWNPETPDEFVHGGKKSARTHASTHIEESNDEYVVRASISGRVPVDVASALRRAFMDHKAKGKYPKTRDGIIAEALREWLKKRDYLV